jgi:transposase
MLSGKAVHMLQNIHKETSALRPVEVVTSVERRRRWGLKEKARIVAASLAPGDTVTEVARRHDISPQHLHQWRRAAKAGKLLLPLDDDLAFAEVVVARDADRSARAAGVVEVEIDGAVVRVCTDTDLKLAAAVIRLLKAPV